MVMLLGLARRTARQIEKASLSYAVVEFGNHAGRCDARLVLGVHTVDGVHRRRVAGGLKREGIRLKSDTFWISETDSTQFEKVSLFYRVPMVP